MRNDLHGNHLREHSEYRCGSCPDEYVSVDCARRTATANSEHQFQEQGCALEET